MKKCQLLFLGTGGSMGIPVVGCTCPICSSENPKNKRLRPSAAIRIGAQTILIDSSPDFRYQALREGIQNIDSVIITHAHHDHTAGIDDLRIFSLRHQAKIPCLMSEDTLKDLSRRFYYIFDISAEPKITTNLDVTLMPGIKGSVDFAGLKICYITYRQGGMLVNGLRFGDLAYLTDIKDYQEDIFSSLAGVKTLVLSALRHTPSHLHLTVDEAVQFANKVGAQNVWLTHIAHELDHDKTNAYLPDHIRLSYDGLKIDFSAEEV